MSGCLVFAIIFQIIAGIIWFSVLGFTIYFIYKSIKGLQSENRKCCKYKTCYHGFYDFIKYIFIIISLPIVFDDTINMEQGCRELYGDTNANYGSSDGDAISSLLYVLQLLLILTVSFIKAHMTFRGTGLALTRTQLTSICILNVLIWTLLFGLSTLVFMIPDLDVLVSYTVYMFIVVMYIAMTIWAQVIFNSKMNQLAGCERKDEQLMHLIIKHKLLTRCILWCLLINFFIGGVYFATDMLLFWYLFQIFIFIDVMINLLCIMLTYQVVGNIYDAIYKSIICGRCMRSCCLCSFCCCDNKAMKSQKDIDMIVRGTSTAESTVSTSTGNPSIGTGTTETEISV